MPFLSGKKAPAMGPFGMGREHSIPLFQEVLQCRSLIPQGSGEHAEMEDTGEASLSSRGCENCESLFGGYLDLE